MLHLGFPASLCFSTQEVAPSATELNAAGLTIMVTSVTCILTFLVWTYSKVLRRHEAGIPPMEPSKAANLPTSAEHDRSTE
jgi:hypothetical protein